MEKKKIVIIGPAHPLRGGIATFNQRLCQQFTEEGHECCIYSFSLQYPSFLFPGTTQYSSEPAPPGIEIYSVINSMHPLNWWQIGQEIRRIRPDIVLVRYWLPLMGPALGSILRRIGKNKHTRIIALTDNVIPHEKRPGDVPFTRYFVKPVDAFITMSEKVMKDLRQFEPHKPARLISHPLYDNFGDAVSKAAAREKLGIGQQDRILLFFGFIRKYKGLDILLEALQLVQQKMTTAAGRGGDGTTADAAGTSGGAGHTTTDTTDRAATSPTAPETGRPGASSPLQGLKLLVAGEFYDDKQAYLEQIKRLGIEDMLILRTDFIPDSEVKYYMCAADCVIQPYRNATQSGVTPLAYHFEKPMIVTQVGGLADLVPHEKVGLVCEPTAPALAAAIVRYFELGEAHFLPALRQEKEKYAWHTLTSAILELAAPPSGNYHPPTTH